MEFKKDGTLVYATPNIHLLIYKKFIHLYLKVGCDYHANLIYNNDKITYYFDPFSYQDFVYVYLKKKFTNIVRVDIYPQFRENLIFSGEKGFCVSWCFLWMEFILNKIEINVVVLSNNELKLLIRGYTSKYIKFSNS